MHGLMPKETLADGLSIADVRVRTFWTTTFEELDSDGHAHPGPERRVRKSLLTVTCENGTEGHAFGSPEQLRPYLLERFIRKVLAGQDALARERLWQDMAHWQRGSGGQLSDRTLAIVDCALWDLAGKAAGLPVYRLIGAYRDKVPAYGSIMCGDEIEGGLATPEDYGRFAEALVARGYQAIKLHTWMPPVSWSPSIEMDLKACAAVREAVGPRIPLMLDAYHWYSREEAAELGRGLEALNFTWIEEVMDEQSMSSYAWLAAELKIPVIGPESMGGKHKHRAEWIRNGACDILRTGVEDVGGITPALKTMHLAESFGMNCEVHGHGAENLAISAVSKNCRWYERGLLHPMLDYDRCPDYLNAIPDAMDAGGFVHLSQAPGIGEDIDFDYIDANLAD
ncbi:mandelate racemase family protein [Poseidonocella sp. HB161398]|uniref:mandelate racemase family protein n=1 Tax=Poseidonocella sp. HB161398 TaxID=2320855 RepID=UPI001F102ED6|nr:mandelate racemase family protein [Poseidonocella sp. HB161398]